jgi:hypothetical protein
VRSKAIPESLLHQQVKLFYRRGACHAEQKHSQSESMVHPPVGAGKSADFLVDGVKTELKILEAGEGGPTTIKNAIEGAAKQGKNIIVDAQGTNLTAEQAANQIARAQGNIGGLQGRVLVYTKDGVTKF